MIPRRPGISPNILEMARVKFSDLPSLVHLKFRIGICPFHSSVTDPRILFLA
jgi:hypothetical protein